MSRPPSWEDMQSMGYNNTEENPSSSISPQRELLSCWSGTYWFGPYWRLVNSFPMDSAGWCITRSKLITCWQQESLIETHATVWLLVLFHAVVSGKTTNKPCWDSAEKTPHKQHPSEITTLQLFYFCLDMLWQGSEWDTNYCQQTDSHRCRKTSKNHAQDLSFSSSMGNYFP